jgi:hypothetical protein
VVKALEESVAVRVQEPVDVIVSALKVATPATATAVVVPPRVQAEVSATVSTSPVPDVSTLPYKSSTDTLKVVKTADSTTVAGGSVVNATFVAAPAVTVTPVLAAVASVSVESVAVRVQGLVPPSMTSAPKVAIPEADVAVVVPASEQEEVIAITSADPLFAGCPAAFSTFTENEVRVAPAAVVVGGSGPKASFVAVVETIVTAALVTVNVLVVSVAIRVQDVPAVMVNALKVATPAAAVTVIVPPRVHDDEIVIESVAPVPDVITVLVLSSTDTEKLERATERVASAGGATV